MVSMRELQSADNFGGMTQFALPSIAAAAHELKSPLATIRQLALAIQEGTASPEEIAIMAERIGLTSERSLRLTADLTRGSRLQDSLFELEPLDVRPLCQDVLHELAPLYRAKGQRLVVRRRVRNLPLVVAHRDLLRRILINFADNALYYAAADSPVELFASYRRRRDVIRLGVRDYGPGVPAGLMKSLDEPIKLAYRPSSSGLGLYLTKRFAEAMNAEVGVVQHRDGVSFYVELSRSTQLRLL